MSDSDESGVTYTEVSSPLEDLSDIRSLRTNDHEHLELPGMLDDPYVEFALQAPRSPDYIPGPEELEQAPPLPDYVPGPEHADDDLLLRISQDDDKDLKEDPVDYPVDGGDDEDDEEGSSEDDEDDDMDIEADEEEEEEEEEHPAPADSLVVALPAADQAHLWRRLSSLVPVPACSDSEVAKLLAMSSPPSSPLSRLSSPPP
nr:hypothetical protein [Tanacetum cinerariifolium]